MEQRINQIISSLKKVVKEQGLTISDERLFSEALTCYRGEEAGKPRKGERVVKDSSKPATAKQLAYVQKLADENNFDLKLTGKETSIEISKIIEGLKDGRT